MDISPFGCMYSHFFMVGKKCLMPSGLTCLAAFLFNFFVNVEGMPEPMISIYADTAPAFFEIWVNLPLSLTPNFAGPGIVAEKSYSGPNN